jgi:phosphodiesterase/alkaline phosphatase D-like protein
MWVEWSTSERFSHVHRIAGPNALPDTDHTARVVLEDLPAGEPVFYRVQWEDLAESGLLSEPVNGSFRTAPRRRRDVLFAWSGDVCGQGWGIDTARGGMRGWETVRAAHPDFFVHSGDTIHADNPLVSEVRLDDGSLWKNEVTPEKSKVAETLAEFRGCQSYNRRDENLRRFSAEVPILAQWDDHETMNNWYPQRILRMPAAAGAVYSAPTRTQRPNRQETPATDTDFMGSAQVRWLKRETGTKPRHLEGLRQRHANRADRGRGSGASTSPARRSPGSPLAA